MKSRLELLLDNEDFFSDAPDCEYGVFVNEYNDVVEFIFVKNDDFFTVYLSIFDEEPPYRDILVAGAAQTLEGAKFIAERKLHQKFYHNKIS